jgi:hypothetical protein
VFLQLSTTEATTRDPIPQSRPAQLPKDTDVDTKGRTLHQLTVATFPDRLQFTPKLFQELGELL